MGVFDAQTELPGELSLADREWHSPDWGNFETNIAFLTKTGVLGSSSHILEIGCGKGRMLKALKDAGHTVCGIDIAEFPIAECRRCYPTIDVRLASGDAIPFPDASFDIVLSFDVFEHIRDSDRHLREVMRVLKPTGQYLLQTPNKWTNIPFELLRAWRKYRNGPIRAYKELLMDHCSLHTCGQLRRRFRRAGLDTLFVDMPVVNEYFLTKMRTYFGAVAKPMLVVANPDRLPRPLRTNFYVKATRAA